MTLRTFPVILKTNLSPKPLSNPYARSQHTPPSKSPSAELGGNTAQRRAQINHCPSLMSKAKASTVQWTSLRNAGRAIVSCQLCLVSHCVFSILRKYLVSKPLVEPRTSKPIMPLSRLLNGGVKDDLSSCSIQPIIKV
jgi:hypothetical protein